jgi:hypothetical protein
LFILSPQGESISYQTCVHVKNTCTKSLYKCLLSFMYHMLLYLKKLQIYYTSKLVHAFLYILYIWYTRHFRRSCYTHLQVMGCHYTGKQ